MALAEQKRDLEKPRRSIFDRYPELKRIPPERFPKNIFIIPDGHGRWATLHKLGVQAGHERGAKVMVDAFRDLNELSTYIPFVGAWGFSVDNLTRSAEEVSFLMDLFNRTIQRLEPELKERNNRFIHIGRKDILWKYPELNETIGRVEDKTAKNAGQVLYMALGFGGEDQEVRIAQKIAEMSKNDPQLNITADLLKSLRDGNGIPPADLIIRSSGEHRLSDVGWLQGKGTELYFDKKLLPNFTTSNFIKAIIDFSKRERRFGGRPRTN